MPRKKKPDDGIITTSIGVARGRRAFVQLAAMGECDDNGRAVFSVGYKGKFIAERDRMLATLAVPLLAALLHHAHYSSSEALRADLEELRGYVAGLGEREKVAADAAPLPAADGDAKARDDGESD